MDVELTINNQNPVGVTIAYYGDAPLGDKLTWAEVAVLVNQAAQVAEITGDAKPRNTRRATGAWGQALTLGECACMGAYTDSHISTARKPKPCAECNELIEVGQRKLNFRLSGKEPINLHVSCAVVAFRQRGDWLCRAVESLASETERKVLTPREPR